MPYAVKWLIPDRLMLSIHYGVVSSDDMMAYIDESMAMRDAANDKNGVGGALVHTLTDARAMTRVEIKLKDMQGVLRALRGQKVGWSVYVNPSAVDRFVVSVSHQMVGVRHYICATMEEALTFLTTNDETLPAVSVTAVDALVHETLRTASTAQGSA
ncbi:MAG: hypothetical protein SGJ24_11085 [Chloroflexota bacterium]|nr:hypothetical protein [Chloroflexota bacterium]